MSCRDDKKLCLIIFFQSIEENEEELSHKFGLETYTIVKDRSKYQTI